MLHVLKFFIYLQSQKLEYIKTLNNMRMNKLAFTRRFTFAVLSLLITANLWGQAALSGSGTEESPYQITSVADWNIFANEANAATYWASGVYIKLSDTWDNSSDEVSTMVGTNTNKFSGIFDGNGKTLTFTKSYSGVEDNPIAPFLYVNGATIRNLTVDGEITTTVDGAAGLIGYNTGTTTVQHVKVSADIYAENQQNCGGFAIDGTGVSFTSCVYDGTIRTSGHSGGFCGLGTSTTNFTNCIFIPVAGSSFISGGEGANFAYGEIGTVTNSFYTKKIGSSTQGKLAYTSMENNKIYRKITELGITVYHVITVSMTGYADNYVYTGSEITKPTITLQGLTLDTDYTVQYKFNNSVVDNILNAGPYTLTISGVNGNNYYGSVVKNFVVGLSGSGASDDPYRIANASDWSTLIRTVENGYTYSGKTVKLTADIGTAENPITTMVGVWHPTEGNRKPFSGTFNGDNHTITVRYTNSTDGNYTAPFLCTNGAIIKQLTVAGDINTSVGYAAGLVGGTYGSVSKVQNNVTVSVDITNGSNGSAGNYCAGVAVDGSYLEISSCVYNGKIKAGNNSAGFIAIGKSTNTKLNTCFFAPAAESSISGGHNFVANNTYNRLATSYYTSKVGSSTQGSRAYSSYGDVPSSGFWMKKQLIDNNDYYVSGTGAITGLHSPYYQHSAQSGGIIFTVTFKESDLTAVDVAPSSYTVTYLNGETPVNISEIGTGDFTLKITGNEGYCKGSLTAAIHIDASIALNGTGTEDDPYKIASNTDWNTFADAVNAGHTFFGEYLKLTNKITLTINNKSNSDKIPGIVENDKAGKAIDWFSGTFDGGWDTIVFNVGKSDTAYTPGHKFSPSAPFRAIDGATIKNLTVQGTIYSNNKYNSGLVGYAFNTNTKRSNNINNCTSSIIIDLKHYSNPSDCSSAGFVAENKQGRINFTNCIFNGTIDKGSNHSSGAKGAGFVSYNSGTRLYFTNCTMAGIITLTENYSTFWRNGDATFSNAYYVNNYGGIPTSGCYQAPTDAPTDNIAKIYTKNSTDYYVPGAVITGVATTYSYIEGQPVEITPVVKYYGKTLTRGTDYNIKIDGLLVPTADTPTLNAEGDHTFTIEGIGGYGGSYSKTIQVLSFSQWSDVKNQLYDDSQGDRTITLSSDITAAVNDATNTALVVKGTVTLNLNEHTINRSLVHVNENHEIVEDFDPDYNGLGLVIIVESGANLTINGPGKITGGFHKGDATYIDGGGIYNKGTLVLNEVNVVGNKVIKMTDEVPGIDNKYTGRGGGIYSGKGSSLTMSDVYIKDNEAKGGGGGAFVDGANTFNVTSSYTTATVIGYNVSEDKGGGLRLAPGNNTTYNISGCYFAANSVTDKNQSMGGGIYMDGESNSTSRVNLNTCVFMDNTAYLKGGAVFSKRGVIYATNCYMEMNMTVDQDYVVGGNSYGGSIYLQASGTEVSTYTMNGGTIEGCRTVNQGGAVYVESNAIFNVLGNVQIKDCYVPTDNDVNTSNNTYLDGSAVHVVGPLGSEAMICIANNNSTGTFMEVDPSLSPEVKADIQAHFTEHFTLDNTDYNMVYDGSNFVIYEPYSWNKTETWETSAISSVDILSEGLPTASSAITLKRAVKIPSDCVAIANSIRFADAGELIIEDGGQLLYNTSIKAKIVKNIAKAPTYESGWYTISSSVHDENSITESLDNVEHLKNEFYDLFAYDEPTHYWINCKNDGDAGFTTLTPGRGYIYRRSNNQKIKFAGETNVGSINYNVTYTSDAGTLKGFNLIGNPYTHNITLKYTTLKNGSDEALPAGSQLTGYYVLDGAGGWGTKLGADDEIAPAQGFLVQIPEEAAKVNFQQTAQIDRANNDFMRFAISNDEYEDVTYALFAKGLGLTKIGHRNPDIPMVYINQNEQDYAIATMGDDTKSFNLNFEANTTGRYTLSLKTEGEFNYIHLIDKIAEEEIDLLADGEYSFIGSPADMADRFVVRLAYLPDYSDEDNDNFVYQSGNEVLVSGEGTLQVFDVMGRLVMQKQVNGVETWSAASVQTGVYILRMNDKTQKIIIK